MVAVQFSKAERAEISAVLSMSDEDIRAHAAAVVADMRDVVLRYLDYDMDYLDEEDVVEFLAYAANERVNNPAVANDRELAILAAFCKCARDCEWGIPLDIREADRLLALRISEK